MNNPNKRRSLLLIAALFLGSIAWILPMLLFPVAMLDSPVETLLFILILLTGGAVMGYLDPPFGVFYGAVTMVPIFTWSTIDGMLGFHSHNLYGIEIVLYAVFTLPAILGAGIGGFSKYLLSRRHR
jgi:hypothetical protein